MSVTQGVEGSQVKELMRPSANLIPPPRTIPAKHQTGEFSDRCALSSGSCVVTPLSVLSQGRSSTGGCLSSSHHCILTPLPWTRGTKTTGQPVGQKGLPWLVSAAKSPSPSGPLLSSSGTSLHLAHHPSGRGQPVPSCRTLTRSCTVLGLDPAFGTGMLYCSLPLFYKGSGEEAYLL